MDGIAPEVTEEVFVFFEDGDGDTLAGEEEAKHDTCGSAADDAAGGLRVLVSGGVHVG
jgi:hypothetical protein